MSHVAAAASRSCRKFGNKACRGRLRTQPLALANPVSSLEVSLAPPLLPGAAAAHALLGVGVDATVNFPFNPQPTVVLRRNFSRPASPAPMTEIANCRSL